MTGEGSVDTRAYTIELYEIVSSFPEGKRRDFLLTFLTREKNPVVGFGLSAFLGSFGVDRFYRGQVFLGILKLVTFGGFGIWTLVDWFITAGAIRETNITLARELKISMQPV